MAGYPATAVSIRTAAERSTKTTLYSYLRHRGVAIGAYKTPALPQKVMKVELSLTVENTSTFVRGKNKSRDEIEERVLRRYGMEKPH